MAKRQLRAVHLGGARLSGGDAWWCEAMALRCEGKAMFGQAQLRLGEAWRRDALAEFGSVLQRQSKGDVPWGNGNDTRSHGKV